MSKLHFVRKERIHDGWSKDLKYCAVGEDGTRYLLRISPGEQYAKKQMEFRMMEQVAALGIPMPLPLELGFCEEGVYSVQSWIDGVEAKAAISGLSDTRQYVYGLEAGRILRKIHSVPLPDFGNGGEQDGGGSGAACKAQGAVPGKPDGNAGTAPRKEPEDWETRFNRKIDRKIKGYRECSLQYEGGEHLLRYIEENRHLLKGRPQGYQHGDYHIGNMMVDRAGQLQILDFDRFDYGDPWEEFNRIVWCAQASPLFASGMVNGYFDGEVPALFWKLLALYIASNTISSLYWAIPYGQKEIDTMQNQAAEVLSWYDNMQKVIPSWYFEGYYIQYIDGIPYKLKEPFDFSFLGKYGRAFQVFDDQDSGNICFGMERDGERYFIKFAGAPAERSSDSPREAVERLKAAGILYRDLQHENLIQLLEAEAMGGGFALVFRWAEGDCMGRMYPEAHRRFMALPAESKMGVFRDILRFLEYTASRQYVAVDFYDGSILYDFETGKTSLCDIDFFRRQPCVNDMGRMWGSSLFQAPEEYRFGAVLDEVTNVYTAGAFAFALFGEYERTRDSWHLSERLYEIAAKAVAEDRNQRYQSLRQFREAWEESWDGAVSLM